MTTLTAPNPTTAVDLPKPGGWAIFWRGHTFTDRDVSGQHLATLSLISGSDDYVNLDIDPRHGHQRLMMMISAFVAVQATVGMDAADADKVAAVIGQAVQEVASASADEILSSLKFH